MNERSNHYKTVQRRVQEFERKFGRGTLHLAYHAALPVVLNTELLHLLRINFLFDLPESLPYTAETDLLLSPICQEIGDELYEIDSTVRDVLLQGLAIEYSYERIRQVAGLLWQYIERRAPWGDQVSLERAQQLTALNYLDPKKAKQWLSRAEVHLKHPAIGEREWFIAMRKEMKRNKKDWRRVTPPIKTNYKVLTLSIDGTLIGRSAYPTPRVVEAIKTAKEKGIVIILSTSRPTESCYSLLRQLGLDGLHIFFDGAVVVEWPSNDIIFLQALSPRAVQRLIELAREYELFLEIYAHDFYFIEKDGKLADHQRQKLQINPLVTNLMSLVNRVKLVKGQLLAVDLEEKRRADLITQEMKEFCKISWSLDSTSGIFIGSAVSRYVSKGSALRDILDYLSVDASQTLAIGDSDDDLTILEVAGTKVAMGQAPNKLKNLADWVAPSVDDDGVAVAIERFIL